MKSSSRFEPDSKGKVELEELVILFILFYCICFFFDALMTRSERWHCAGTALADSE